MALKFSAALPVLRTVSVRGALAVATVWLPKSRLLASSAMVGWVAARPVAERAMATGVVRPLCVRFSVALRAPAAVGVKASSIVQLPLAASVVPQVPPLRAKSLPATVMARLFSAAWLLARTVSVCAALVWPTVVLAKLSDEGVLPR